MSSMEGTIAALMAPGRAILAADESQATIARRFEALAIEPTEENRRRYRQMLFTAPGLTQYISGVILFDETLRQRADSGSRFVEILAGSGSSRGSRSTAARPRWRRRRGSASRRYWTACASGWTSTDPSAHGSRNGVR